MVSCVHRTGRVQEDRPDSWLALLVLSSVHGVFMSASLHVENVSLEGQTQGPASLGDV